MDTDFLSIDQDASKTAKTTTYTGTAGTLTAWAPGPKGVWVYVTTDAYVAVGEGVTATTSDLPVPALTPVLLKVPRGTVAPWTVSAIQISSGGSVFAKPVA